MDDQAFKARRGSIFLWVVFIAYGLLLLLAMKGHELWGDEIHSWNIARSSDGLIDLVRNSRYEGHPPLWYVVLFSITRLTHDPEYMKIAQAAFSLGMVFLLLFVSPFPLLVRALIPFGYFFAFEYGVLSRNYATAIFLAFLVTWIITRRPRHYVIWFYLVVFLLSNTHLLGLVLAVSFCVYHAWQERALVGGFRKAMLCLVIGVFICLPAAIQIVPPGESQLNMRFWVDRWTVEQWHLLAEAPIKAFVPIPDTDRSHFWNTNAVLQLVPGGEAGVVVVRFLSIGLVLALCYMLRRVSGSMWFFASNILLTAVVGFVFPLTSVRYVGFIFIGFIIAAWLHSHMRPLGRAFLWPMVLVLTLHAVAAVIAIRRDFSQPFSHSAKVRELYALVPTNAKVVTDYWCLNNLSAYLGRPFYSLELHKELSFLRWDQGLARAMSRPDIYSGGLNALLQGQVSKEVYMISTSARDRLLSRDRRLDKEFEVALLDKYDGAIEPNSNVYLYHIRMR